MVPPDVWRGTEQLADRLGVLHLAAHALALDPNGPRLMVRLPLMHAAWIADQAQASLAVGFARLAQASGPKAKLRVLRQELILADPDGEIGSGSRVRLSAARIRYLLVLLARAPKTLWALARTPGGAERSDNML